MEIEKLYSEWSVAYRAKGGKLTVHGEELFADFFQWLKHKAVVKALRAEGYTACIECGLMIPVGQVLCPSHL